MTIDAASLRDLHHVHQLLDELRARHARGPLQVKAGEAKVERCQQELTSLQEQTKRSRLTLADRELQLKERENRILDLKGKLNSCTTNKEYQAIIERIAADEQANSVLSDEILELLDKIGTQQEGIGMAQGLLAKAKVDLQSLLTRVTAEGAKLATEIASVEQRLSEAERFLPLEARAAYDRVVKAHGADSLARVDDNTCGGCFQRITTQMLNELRMQRLVFCKNCGRLLYLP